jgi:hypothetical protein
MAVLNPDPLIPSSPDPQHRCGSSLGIGSVRYSVPYQTVFVSGDPTCVGFIKNIVCRIMKKPFIIAFLKLHTSEFFLFLLRWIHRQCGQPTQDSRAGAGLRPGGSGHRGPLRHDGRPDTRHQTGTAGIGIR